MKLKASLQQCLPNKHVWLLQCLLFTYFGATHSVVPYLVVHMKQIGIPIHETAIIHAILPVAMFIGPPVAAFIWMFSVFISMFGAAVSAPHHFGTTVSAPGSFKNYQNCFIADKSGGFKILLFTSLLLTGALHTALLWVPWVGQAATIRTDKTSVSCGVVGETVEVSLPGFSDDCQMSEMATVRFSDCVRHCHSREAYDFLEDATLTSGGGGVAAPPHAPWCSHRLASGQDTCVSFENATGQLTFLKLAAEDVRSGHVLVRSERLNDSCNFFVDDNCTLSCFSPPDAFAHFDHVECGDPQKTFWSYLVIRILAAIFMSSCYVLLDGITLVLCKEHDIEYGKQRISPVLATAVFPPITGFLVDYLSSSEGVPNYSPTFWMHDGLLIFTAFMSLFLTVNVTLSSNTNMKTVWRLAKTPRADFLFLTLFVLGTMWGFVEVFLYWYLLDLNSPKYLLGLTLTVGSGIGVPVLFFSEFIINKFGHVLIIFTAFLFYCVRYIGYSFIYNPWWCLAFEAMEIFTLHLLWVAVVKYSTRLAPKGLLATMQGAIGGTHYGVGRGSGSLIGGLMMGSFGARDTFRYMGLASAVAGIIYLAVEKTLFRKPLEPQEESGDANTKNIEDGLKKAEAEKDKGISLSVNVDTRQRIPIK